MAHKQVVARAASTRDGSCERTVAAIHPRFSDPPQADDIGLARGLVFLHAFKVAVSIHPICTLVVRVVRALTNTQSVLLLVSLTIVLEPPDNGCRGSANCRVIRLDLQREAPVHLHPNSLLGIERPSPVQLSRPEDGQLGVFVLCLYLDCLFLACFLVEPFSAFEGLFVAAFAAAAPLAFNAACAFANAAR